MLGRTFSAGARMDAIAGDMKAAREHIDEVLELIDDAVAQRAGSKPSVRAIRGYIAEAGYAITKSNSRGGRFRDG
jgi:enoyl-CoA hydratase/carnithine racemase